MASKRKSDEKTDADMEDEEENPDSDAGIFPDYLPILDEFEDMIVWKNFHNKKVPEPKPGVDEEFDEKNLRITELKKQMQNYVDDVQKDTGCDKVSIF